MLKKTVKYENLFTGEEVEEDLYFHLSQAELVELEMGVAGGLSEKLKRIVATNDNQQIIDQFKEIILVSYGQKSDDGRHFRKSPEIRAEFLSSEAYSTFFMELIQSTDKLIEFIKGIVPAGLEAAVEEAIGTQPALQAVPDDPEFAPKADEPGDESLEVRQTVPSDDEVGKGDN